MLKPSVIFLSVENVVNKCHNVLEKGVFPVSDSNAKEIRKTVTRTQTKYTNAKRFCMIKVESGVEYINRFFVVEKKII